MFVTRVKEGDGAVVGRFIVWCRPLVGDGGVIGAFMGFLLGWFPGLCGVLSECFFCLVSVRSGVLGGGVDDELFDGWCWGVGEHFGGFGEERGLGV